MNIIIIQKKKKKKNQLETHPRTKKDFSFIQVLLIKLFKCSPCDLWNLLARFYSEVYPGLSNKGSDRSWALKHTVRPLGMPGLLSEQTLVSVVCCPEDKNLFYIQTQLVQA